MDTKCPLIIQRINLCSPSPVLKVLKQLQKVLSHFYVSSEPKLAFTYKRVTVAKRLRLRTLEMGLKDSSVSPKLPATKLELDVPMLKAFLVS